MFGKNTIVGKKFFENADGKLLVTSVFMTLQGEGPFRGEPAVFVRLAMCNLACSFCDTYFNSGDWYTPDELSIKIADVISEYFDGHTPQYAQYLSYFEGGRTKYCFAYCGPERCNCMVGVKQREITVSKRKMGLVITGGEPMLQDALVPFLDLMDKEFKWMQIESNGTQYQPLPSHTTLVLSPKCAEKNGKPTKYLEPNEKVLDRADCLKFVMCADSGSPYNSIPEWALAWRDVTKKPVFVSPMNIYNREPQASKILRAGSNDITIDQRSKIDEVISFWEEGLLDMKANQINHEYTAKYCVQNGLTLNLQLHLYASLA